MATLDCCTIEHTKTVDRYLKTLFQNRGGVSDLARSLGVAPPSVTAMMHRLRDAGLVEPESVRLTPHGLRHAHGAVRRHRLLETFLHDVLGVRWDEVHVEAEKLEFGLSERLEDLIDAQLGYPRHDPHGDPIPPKYGTHDEGAELPLAAAGPGDRFRVLRVNDRDPGALRALAAMHVGLGAELEVLTATTPEGRRVRAGDRDLVLTAPLVHAIRGEFA
ncbi:metal-dependent transcriptional regulator [Cryptosporangium sp. NPDC051539]|uniref:metal-dependent transcriptional regulator n=1 Tax=Cryptosporangium sp. NPDC051539 TaxID=3363962 RepID=UPI0037A4757A